MSMSAIAPGLSVAQLQEAAIEISRILRDAKVDAPLRPKALAAVLVATIKGTTASPGAALASLQDINRRVARAVAASNLAAPQQRKLLAVLRLAGADFERLTPWLPRIREVLQRLGADALLDGGVDFFGVFYEAFLRYGYDNNALGIVFTPRHITRFCAELVGVGPSDRVIDLACGTGGFLVAAHEQIRRSACTPARQPHKQQTGSKRTATALAQPRSAICGFDTNPTVWALAVLNMWFREDFNGQVGRKERRCDEIELGSCFDGAHRRRVRQRFTRAFLNPPFSQDAEPERDFIDATMDALAPGGRAAMVVKAGIFADDEHTVWRSEFTRRHTVLAIVSLPEDVFYPTAAPTSILVAEAHRRQPDTAPVLMARVWNDGFEKLKNKRVERDGGELPEVKRCFHQMMVGEPFCSPLAVTVAGARLQQGVEWSPQEWLPQPKPTNAELEREQRQVMAAIYRAVIEMPDLADAVLPVFASAWQQLSALPLGNGAALSEFFHVVNGRSAGGKRYEDGVVPYVSSGGAMNSIVRMVDASEDEVFADGGITVTAFGQAAVQPWPFVARGNGGSSVRVLVPRYRMGFGELVWFAAQINAQCWRFFYARMAIKSRLERLVVASPPRALPGTGKSVAERVRELRDKLAELSAM